MLLIHVAELGLHDLFLTSGVPIGGLDVFRLRSIVSLQNIMKIAGGSEPVRGVDLRKALMESLCW